ncbi:RsmG family class I SAM-dependent methyltransferase [Roseobacter sp. TSBP12]|uniref:16S rRNA (guanine(527)-N(7))-methyltransferase RsmG n=1 Tax=Roseobacter sp. TSBP12 TaxID=1236613 RepID=UPI00336A04AD
MKKISFAGLDVSRETFERLEAYFSILKKWNPVINLVAKSTIENAWDRHFLDSAQVFALAPKESKSWVDIGSGGGFPGWFLLFWLLNMRQKWSLLWLSPTKGRRNSFELWREI